MGAPNCDALHQIRLCAAFGLLLILLTTFCHFLLLFLLLPPPHQQSNTIKRAQTYRVHTDSLPVAASVSVVHIWSHLFAIPKPRNICYSLLHLFLFATVDYFFLPMRTRIHRIYTGTRLFAAKAPLVRPATRNCNASHQIRLVVLHLGYFC